MDDCLKNKFFSWYTEKCSNNCCKKWDMGGKEIYRPVSILSNFSKVFERLIYNQLNDFMETKFSKFLTGFRKNHNAQNALLRMIENWKMQLNKRKRIGVIVMDLSKTFDTLNAALCIKSYVTNRYQRCKIRNSFHEWERS